jgi:phosphoribosylanthranilate isomerase
MHRRFTLASVHRAMLRNPHRDPAFQGIHGKQMRTRVKICGLTRPEDARAAVIYGADAIGLVFYPPSPRAVTPERAAEVVAGLPPFVTVVGLFVDAGRERIAEVLRRVRIDLLQFHGDESPAECEGHGRPWIRALRVHPGLDLAAERGRFAGASALLLDACRPGVPGGTGSRFDWGLIPRPMAGEIVLAGGLDQRNVEQAVREVRPYAVDVSGGVERSKGIKDPEKIAAFIRGVRRGQPSDA